MASIDETRDGLKTIVENDFNTLVQKGALDAMIGLTDINYSLASKPENILIVASSNGDFTTIKDAMASITDNSEINRYVIEVAPGIVEEDNPIQGKSYVTVKAVGDNNNVRVVAKNPNQHLFLGAHLFYISKLSLFGVTGVGKYAVAHEVAGEMVLRDIVYTDCDNCVLINHTDALMNILDNGIYTPSSSTINGISVLAGNLTLDFLKVVGDSTVSKLIDSDGVNSFSTINNLVSFSSNVTTVTS
jgi:hypothetical protein